MELIILKNELKTIKLLNDNELCSQCLYHIQIFCEKLFKQLNKIYLWSELNGVDEKKLGHTFVAEFIKSVSENKQTNSVGFLILNKNIEVSKYINKNDPNFSRNNLLEICESIKSLLTNIKNNDDTKNTLLKLKENMEYCVTLMYNLTIILKQLPKFETSKFESNHSDDTFIDDLKKIITRDGEKYIYNNMKITYKNNSLNKENELFKTLIFHIIFLISIYLGPINNLSRYGFGHIKENDFITAINLTPKQISIMTNACELIFNFICLIEH
jgi:hypothetical protein